MKMDPPTGLHTAVQRKSVEEARFYLNEGSQGLETYCHHGRTPLHNALLYEHKQMYWLLLEAGANINAIDRNGLTPLHYAVNNRDTELVVYLLSEGVEIDVQDFRGNTPLHCAVVKSFKPAIICLLENGSKINEQDEYGNTPLHLAVKSQYWEIIEKLLIGGADVEKRNDKHETVLLSACSVKTESIAVEWEEDHSDPQASTASKYSLETACELLCARGANVNAKDLRGRTPLHCAIMNKHLKVVEILLAKEAVMTLADSNGETSLHYAVRYCSSAILLLVEKGCDVNMEVHCGLIPLVYTTYSSTKENCNNVVEMLLCCGYFVHFNSFGKINVLSSFDYGLKVFCEFLIKIQALLPFISIKTNKYLDSLAYFCYNHLDQSVVRRFKVSCLEEIKKMNVRRFGRHSMLNIFSEYNNAIFALNYNLEQAVNNLPNLKKQFPIFATLLNVTFRKAKNRLNLLNILASQRLEIPLPDEVVRMILTHLDDEDLKKMTTGAINE